MTEIYDPAGAQERGRELWYETIDPQAIAKQMMELVREQVTIPDGWMAPLTDKIKDYLAEQLGDELGIIGAELELNQPFGHFYTDWLEQDPPPGRIQS